MARWPKDVEYIGDKDLHMWEGRLVPLQMRGDGLHRIKTPTSVRHSPFMWQGKLLYRVEEVSLLSIENMSFSTDDPAMFMPTLAEVFAQVPRHLQAASLWEDIASRKDVGAGFYLTNITTRKKHGFYNANLTEHTADCNFVIYRRKGKDRV